MPTKTIIETFEREYNRKKNVYLETIREPAEHNYKMYLLELTDPFRDNLKSVLMDMGKAFKVTTKKGVSEIISFSNFHRITEKYSGLPDLDYEQRERLRKNQSVFFTLNLIVEFNLKDSTEYAKLIAAKKNACEEEKRLQKEIKDWIISQEMKPRAAGLEEYHGLDDVVMKNIIECNENDL